MLAAIVVVPLGDWVGLPSPVLMTLVGGVLALIPQVPNVQIDPELILPLMLPPLLYASVQRTSWRQFAANRRAIFLLAVALVFVTTGGGGGGGRRGGARHHAGRPPSRSARWSRRPTRWRRPRSRAASGLPRRMISILEGEGLFNDVTAIVLYHVAVAAAVSGDFSLPHACSNWCCPRWSRSWSAWCSAGARTG